MDQFSIFRPFELGALKGTISHIITCDIGLATIFLVRAYITSWLLHMIYIIRIVFIIFFMEVVHTQILEV